MKAEPTKDHIPDVRKMVSETELIAEFENRICVFIKKTTKKELEAHCGTNNPIDNKGWLLYGRYQGMVTLLAELERRQAARNLITNYKAVVLSEWIEGEKKRADILATVNKKVVSDVQQKTASAIFKDLEKQIDDGWGIDLDILKKKHL